MAKSAYVYIVKLISYS